MSAHRTPEQVDEYARTAEDRGLVAIICGAGRAAHLAGAVAARTVLPVIGVPVGADHLGGADALYSTVQMPRGVPVATVGIDGAVNAAVLAAQIIGIRDPDVRAKLHDFKESLAEGFKL
jgi:phosphoribosylaminoimidazole carboxylase PurE protein